jgi:polar amino acid transport system substrate-binding protein
MKGVAIDLGRELARRIGVQFEVVSYPTVVALIDSAKSGQWDITFIGINPDRAKYIDFSATYAEVEMGCLVPKGSPISTISDVDRPGTRIAVQEKGGADVRLTTTLKNARLVRGSTIADGVEMLRSGKADALAAVKTFLFPASDNVPGSRVLEGRITVTEIGIGVPKGHDISALYARKFVENAKSEGLVKAAIERAGLRRSRGATSMISLHWVETDANAAHPKR